MKHIARLEKSRSFWFLVFFSVSFFILRLPSLLEPYWYGDEGVYQAVGLLINAGEKLYIGAWDNKPPLLYVLYALLNSNQFAIRFVSLIFGLVSVWFFYLIAIKLFKKSLCVNVSTLLFSVVLATPFIEGDIANTENFIILPVVACAYLVLHSQKIKEALMNRNYFFAGLIISLAFLAKIVAFFDFLAFSTFITIDSEKNFKERLIPFVAGLGIPVLITMGYFFLTNNFKDFMDAFLLNNISYVGYNNKLIIPQGLLIIKGILLSSFIALLYLRRKNIPSSVLFVLTWFAFSLFSAFFSQRPYTHYLIVLLPSFCLMLGLLMEDLKQRAFILLVFLLGFLAVFKTFHFYTGIIPYYKNIISFANNKSVKDYRAFFDPITPRDYEVAMYLKNNSTEKDLMFLWGNNAQLYKLTNKKPLFRYTVAYHITMYPTGIEEMKSAILRKKPRYIVIMPNVPQFPLSLLDYTEKMDIDGVKIYEKLF